MFGAAALAAYATPGGGELWPALAGAGALAVALLLVAMVAGWPSGIAAALLLLAAVYAASLAIQDEASVDTAAPLYAAGLLVVAELAYWSLELRAGGREEARVVVRRFAALAALTISSVVLGAFVIAVTAFPLGGGLIWNVIGVAAAAATLGVLALLARRSEPDR